MRWHRFGWLLLALAVAGVAFVWVRAIGGPAMFRARYGWWGVGVAVLAHGALNLTPAGEIIPSAIANGAIWGFSIGAVVNWLGWIAASVVQYALLRRAFADPDAARAPLRLPPWLARIPLTHPLFQVLARSVPWVGLHVVNIAAATAGLRFGRFLLLAAIGQAGPAIVMAAVGARIGRLL